jgi:DNA-binding GntR family transcriptional regulator
LGLSLRWGRISISLPTELKRIARGLGCVAARINQSHRRRPRIRPERSVFPRKRLLHETAATAAEAKFGGSRTPVRAALIRLEAEGLVQREGRNWTVSPIDLREIEALYEFREPLEAAAIRLVCRRADAGDLDALEALLESCDAGAPREEWRRVGTEFHIGLARLSGNPFLLKAVEDVMTRLARPRWLEVWTEPKRDQAWSDHRRILELDRRNMPDEAGRESLKHIHYTRDRLLRSLREDRRGLRARGFAVINQ